MNLKVKQNNDISEMISAWPVLQLREKAKEEAKWHWERMTEAAEREMELLFPDRKGLN